MVIGLAGPGDGKQPAFLQGRLLIVAGSACLPPLNTSLYVIIHLTSLVKEPLMSKDKPTITHADDWGHDRDRANAKRASRLLLERLEAVHPEGGERRCATDGSIKSNSFDKSTSTRNTYA